MEDPEKIRGGKRCILRGLAATDKRMKAGDDRPRQTYYDLLRGGYRIQRHGGAVYGQAFGKDAGLAGSDGDASKSSTIKYTGRRVPY